LRTRNPSSPSPQVLTCRREEAPGLENDSPEDVIPPTALECSTRRETLADREVPRCLLPPLYGRVFLRHRDLSYWWVFPRANGGLLWGGIEIRGPVLSSGMYDPCMCAATFGPWETAEEIVELALDRQGI